ncbi:type-2 ice-structuring protein-like [Poeciliopsis prolifica]|uniref:type-2 ice-structuring protein-like n=1 Tax=Poeciliopsis prolifica TaxID=188132 RepID=UPI0024144CB6|nr:type-2 ice-structuring protein-like [Poeciliopsis prolifica]
MKLSAVFLMVFSMMALTSGSENRFCSSHLSNLWEPCPSGWRKINKLCFRYVGTRLTWFDAEKNCQSMGGNLASIYNMDYYTQVQKLIRDKTGRDDRAWLGGSDAHWEGSWLWRDNIPVTFTYWCRGEPNNFGFNQHCLEMNFSGGKCWDDMWCDGYLPSVCFKKL